MTNQWDKRLDRLGPGHLALWNSWLARNSGTRHREELVAWVIRRPNAAATEVELRLHLSHSLPAYMIPSRLILAADLPRNASGKLARDRLTDALAPATRHESISPRNPSESKLAALFEEILKTGPVGVNDDFFADLGGHSLLAAQLISRMRRERGTNLPLRLLFEHPTVAGLVQALAHIETVLKPDQIQSDEAQTQV